MGGIGSGRQHQYVKDTAEDSRPLDIRKLNRSGLLIPGGAFGWQWTIGGKAAADIQIKVGVERVVLAYRFRLRGNSDWQDVEQSVNLDYTACTYGGKRIWWLCPSCDRRVAVLYGPGKHYACRHCSNLVYTCQRESDDDRAARRANKIRRKLGWQVGILNPTGEKPKGMHYSTYQRLTHQHNIFAGVSLDGIMERMGLINTKLGRVDEDLNLFRKNQGAPAKL